jgi:hypothetical protein
MPGVARGSYQPRIRAELSEETAYLLKLHPDFAAEYFSSEITSKICSACDVEQDLEYFSPSSSGHLGVKARCKTCCAKAARDYANKPEGKAARARAQAQYRAHLATAERNGKARAAFVEVASGTDAGRALLSSLEEMTPKPKST